MNKAKTLHIVSFSPTGTTQKILKEISSELQIEKIKIHNIANYKNKKKQIMFTEDDLVLFGAPVYSGRIPLTAIEGFNNFTGNNTKTIIVTVYGNRHYDDALLELHNLVTNNGFKPLAAAAFIGEHSFSFKETPIAKNRPDEKDLELAAKFGVSVSEKLNNASNLDLSKKLALPGNFPYKERSTSEAISPVTREEACNSCGFCAELCPTEAIIMEKNEPVTNAENCIRCLACVKNCPENARIAEHNWFKMVSEKLHKNCQNRREPETFI